MTDLIRSATSFAVHMISQYVTAGDILVDATCGNGHDTVKLASMKPSRLYAFDIQAEAVNATRAHLQSKGMEHMITDGTINLIHDSHENMASYIPHKVNAVIFNLGYLPGHDKSITTRVSSTLPAVFTALELLQTGGILCITIYSGHPQGMDEKKALLNWARNLDEKQFHAANISMLNQQNHPPEILLITKKK